MIIIDSYKQRFPLYDIPGLRVAYTLRKPDNANGNCIKVRRAIDNQLRDIGFWGRNLDVDSLLSFVGVGSGFIDTWYDPVNGNNIIQPIPGNQPRIVNNGVLETINGKPAIKFIADSYLSNNVSVFTGALHTVFTVYETGVLNSGNEIQFILDTGTDSSVSRRSMILLSANKMTISRDGGDGGNVLSSSTAIANNQYVASAIFGSSAKLRINTATQTGSTGSNQAVSLSPFVVGARYTASSYWRGKIAEIIVSNNALNATQENTVLYNQSTFFNIPI